ncbi:probable E3 ubiquitin-protein ligase ZFP1 isoform X2 [Durio zibethinus]|uniref:RING-type E3 ubiquitin transferase n=1 Tax=Durio zibethinus TaxID=66656 RepID=A0A6P5XYP5_DURZI|nr:probable E3 ubiquitin-protein ligase ZFP1 isoform X2 [Durio zibethinus]
MGQRNMQCPSQMIDLEMDQQGQGYLHHEPCIFLGGITNYPPPDIQMAVTAPGNTTSLDPHPLPEHYESSMFFGMPQYPGVQHRYSPNLDLGIGSASNFYIPNVATHSSGVPVNHGPTDQMPSSGNCSLLGVSAGEYARNCHFMDNARGLYKRKNSEGIPGNFQHFNASSSSSSSVSQLNSRHPDGVGTADAASFTIPQYRGNGPPPIRDAGSQRSMRNRLGATAVDPVLMHSTNQFFQGNYMGQPFHPTITNGGAPAWTQAPGVPFMHGSNIGGPMETRHRSSTNFSHSSPLDLRNHNYHHPAPPIEGVRGHSINVHPQLAAVPYHFPANYASQSTMNPSQDSLEMGRRHLGPFPPTGFRIYHSRREVVVPETTLRHRNLPHLRVLPPDGVAVLEFPEFYEEVGNFIDHHRDMRLDIEDMSYEELLALGERIGNVNTGLSEETVMSKLKTRTYSTFATNINLKEAAPIDQEPDSCIICQEDYKNEEKIGTLDCGHEYHAGCLRKWLFVKNVCPICKTEALATVSKDV